MKKVQVTQWQDSHGLNHKTERACLQSEFAMELRGVIQSRYQSKQVSFDPSQVASVIAANGEAIIAIIQKYQRKFRGLDLRENGKVSVKLAS